MAGRYDYTHAERKELIFKIVREVLFWVASCILVVWFAGWLIDSALEKTNVADSSMEPTLSFDDTVLIDTLSYRLRSPKRNEVVVFCQGDAEHSFYNIKRIIGLPGETISIRDGSVWINGKPLTEEVIVDPMLLPGLAHSEITLGEDEYFVLGDARNDSEDSRFATVGVIKRDEFIGRAWLRLNRFGFINSMNRVAESEE